MLIKSKSKKSILILGMYPIDKLKSAPPIRIYNLYINLKELHPVILLSGRRIIRKIEILKFLISGKIRNIKLLYVEPSNVYASEMDILLIFLCKILRIPIFTFMRDIYHLYPNAYPVEKRIGIKWLKLKILKLLAKYSSKVYQRFSNILYFPAKPMYKYYKHSCKKLLPPGGVIRNLTVSENLPFSKIIFFAGGADRWYGLEILVEAMKIVYNKYNDAKLYLSLNQEYNKFDTNNLKGAPFVKIFDVSTNQIAQIMKNVYLCVATYKMNDYQSITLGLKIFDYMSYKKPILITNCPGPRQIIEETNAGIVVNDDIESIANGIIYLIENRFEANEMATNAYNAIKSKHSWKDRANQILKDYKEYDRDKNKTDPDTLKSDLIKRFE